MPATDDVCPQNYERSPDSGEATWTNAGAKAPHLGTRAVTAADVKNLRILVDWRFWGAADTDRTCLTSGTNVKVGLPPDNTVVCSDTVEDNCYLSCTADRILTQEKATYLQNVIIAESVAWLASALKVIPINGNLTVSGSSACGFQGGIVVPSDYYAPLGVKADIVLFATARPTTSNVIAFAGSCKEDQFGRPIMGHMNFGPNKISLALEDHDMQVGVAAHEMSHALGFQGGKFSGFRIAMNSSTLRSPTLQNVALDVSPADSRSMMVTPKVASTVQSHFACTSLSGGEIEDSGGSGTAGSHWEKRTYNDEYMTGTSSPKPVMSAVTLALFEDSGWYWPDYSVVDRFDWGRGKGCAFAVQDCGKWDALGAGYDCNVARSGVEQCSYDRLAKGFCEIDSYAPTPLPSKYQHLGDAFTGGYSDLADYCPVYRPYSNGICAYASSASSQSAYYGETFDPSSLCYESSLLTVDMPSSSTVRNVCYRSVCMSATGPLRMRVGVIWKECIELGGKVGVANYRGSLFCPDINFICAGMPDIRTTLVWPTFASISPTSVSGDGGDRVTITGTGFFEGMIIYVGEHKCLSVVVNSTTLAQCTVAPQPDVTATRKGPVCTFNTAEQGMSAEDAVQIRAASGGFLTRAKDVLRKLNALIAEHWYWIMPLLVLLLVFCLFSCLCSKKKPNKVAPTPPPSAYNNRYGGGGGGGGYPQRPLRR